MTCLDWMERDPWVWVRGPEVVEVGVTAMDLIPCLAGMAAGAVVGLGDPVGAEALAEVSVGAEVSDGAPVGAEGSAGDPVGAVALAGGFGPEVPLGGEGAVMVETPGEADGKQPTVWLNF